jgi:GH43 family beta-xylosidase
LNAPTQKLSHPILPLHSADPWMIFHGGYYYYSESRDQNRIFIRRARTIDGIGQDAGVCVWTAPARGKNSQNLWAPELHLIDGKWFIYYAADDGKSGERRMWVLGVEGNDPRGKYRCYGSLQTGGWAIDGTVLVLDHGRKYFIWSGWSRGQVGSQNIYIAPMSDPVTVSGERVLIATPDCAWERVGKPICERPQVLKRNGDVLVLYSASGSWTPDYCLGLLHNRNGNLLDPSSWTKHGPVFKKSDQAWGIGHCSFVKSLSQAEDWIIYHSRSSRLPGWEARDVHAQPFTWSSDGFPDFGIPLPVSRQTLQALSPGLGSRE